MNSPLLTVILQYGTPVLGGIIVGLFFKAYFAMRIQNKIRKYQGEILHCHEKILELEELNGKLEKKLQEKERPFRREFLFS